ncbi:MAG: 23S rRNA (pseudouridine(1915)-N(3))-methyltransferase RlmH [Rhodobacteraceae bacterium]|nr:23S rRNA (pseudouridine(1915)-N(3))-methyltransferase RlmH [Paracoccaceae bacterium]
MKIVIAAIGKAKSGPERALYEDYVSRVPWTVQLKEFDFKSERDTAKRRTKEAAALLGAAPDGSVIVALDERGKVESSEKFAARLGAWRDQGRRTVAFLIGGADGHGEAVRKRADLCLAFGPMTWPHMLARAMLAEQLFRAHSILTGHPYHRA